MLAEDNQLQRVTFQAQDEIITIPNIDEDTTKRSALNTTTIQSQKQCSITVETLPKFGANVEQLPSDIWLLIFSYMNNSAKSLCTTAQVCRSFKQYSEMNFLWKDLLVHLLIKSKRCEELLAVYDNRATAATATTTTTPTATNTTTADDSLAWQTDIETEMENLCMNVKAYSLRYDPKKYKKLEAAIEYTYQQQPEKATYKRQYIEEKKLQHKDKVARQKRERAERRMAVVRDKLYENKERLYWTFGWTGFLGILTHTLLMMLRMLDFGAVRMYLPYSVAFVPLYIGLIGLIGIPVVGYIKDILIPSSYHSGCTWRSFFHPHNILNISFGFTVIFVAFVSVKLDVDSYQRHGGISDPTQSEIVRSVFKYAWPVVFLPMFLALFGSTLAFFYELVAKPLRKGRSIEKWPTLMVTVLVVLLFSFFLLLMIHLQLRDVSSKDPSLASSSPLPLFVALIPLMLLFVVVLLLVAGVLIFFTFKDLLMRERQSRWSIIGYTMLFLCCISMLAYLITISVMRDNAVVPGVANFNRRGLSLLALLLSEIFLFLFFICIMK